MAKFTSCWISSDVYTAPVGLFGEITSTHHRIHSKADLNELLLLEVGQKVGQ